MILFSPTGSNYTNLELMDGFPNDRTICESCFTDDERRTALGTARKQGLDV